MRVLILAWLAENLKKALEPKFPELSIHAAVEEENAQDIIEDADILMTFRISDELISRASKLKWLHAMTTGVDYIMRLPSLRKEILITSTHGIHAPQMSETAFILMLALSRNFQQIIRNQDQRIWGRWPMKLLFQKKVGILGMGIIGEEIARKCKAFDMTVLGIDIIKKEIDTVDSFYGPEDLLQVAREVDFLIVVVPFTPQTKKIIGAEAFSCMKTTAFLISIGRGETIDEEALVHALKKGEIAGAGLDTFCTEPLPKESPLWGMKNAIITPHVGGMCDIYWKQALPIVEENLRRYLQGERRNLINFVER